MSKDTGELILKKSINLRMCISRVWLLSQMPRFPRACHICDRLSENSPLRARFNNRVTGSGIFLVMKVTCCRVLAVSVQSFLTTIVN